MLFLGKRGDFFCERALDLCRAFEVDFFAGEWGEPMPQSARQWKGDYIVSYLSRWVVPAELLSRARRAAINFHPGTPDYPGIGCVNFALYNGATCHHMAPEVDTGAIVAVERVPVFAHDDVEALLSRTYEAQFALFVKIIGAISRGEPLPVSAEKWSRKPYTRREYDALNRLAPEFSEAEKLRRIKSCAYRNYFPVAA